MLVGISFCRAFYHAAARKRFKHMLTRGMRAALLRICTP
jgi:hypothetical protein